MCMQHFQLFNLGMGGWGGSMCRVASPAPSLCLKYEPVAGVHFSSKVVWSSFLVTCKQLYVCVCTCVWPRPLSTTPDTFLFRLRTTTIGSGEETQEPTSCVCSQHSSQWNRKSLATVRGSRGRGWEDLLREWGCHRVWRKDKVVFLSLLPL